LKVLQIVADVMACKILSDLRPGWSLMQFLSWVTTN